VPVQLDVQRVGGLDEGGHLPERRRGDEPVLADGDRALAAGSVVSLSLALSRQQSVTGIPVGALALGAAAVYAFLSGRE